MLADKAYSQEDNLFDSSLQYHIGVLSISSAVIIKDKPSRNFDKHLNGPRPSPTSCILSPFNIHNLILDYHFKSPYTKKSHNMSSSKKDDKPKGKEVEKKDTQDQTTKRKRNESDTVTNKVRDDTKDGGDDNSSKLCEKCGQVSCFCYYYAWKAKGKDPVR